MECRIGFQSELKRIITILNEYYIFIKVYKE